MNPKKVNSFLFVILAAFTIFLSSCSNYGKKITIEGTKGEIYYKGDGVTEADAKKLGNYLKENGYLDDKEKTVQLKKEGSNYVVRLVVDKDKVEKTTGLDSVYSFYGATIAKEVFNKTATVIVLCDTHMKDLKTFPYKPEILESAVVKKANELKEMEQKTFASNTLYYSKNISEDEATGLFEYLKTSEFFTDNSNNDLIVTKGDDESAKFQFSVKKEFANEEGLQKVDAFVKQMKADVFKNNTVYFEVLDDQLNSIKTFTY